VPGPSRYLAAMTKMAGIGDASDISADSGRPNTAPFPFLPASGFGVVGGASPGSEVRRSVLAGTSADGEAVAASASYQNQTEFSMSIRFFISLASFFQSIVAPRTLLARCFRGPMLSADIRRSSAPFVKKSLNSSTYSHN
jgi:hypothetical protein